MVNNFGIDPSLRHRLVVAGAAILVGQLALFGCSQKTDAPQRTKQTATVTPELYGGVGNPAQIRTAYVGEGSGGKRFLSPLISHNVIVSCVGPDTAAELQVNFENGTHWDARLDCTNPNANHQGNAGVITKNKYSRIISVTAQTQRGVAWDISVDRSQPS